MGLARAAPLLASAALACAAGLAGGARADVTVPGATLPTTPLPGPRTTATIEPSVPASLLVGDTQRFTITVARNDVVWGPPNWHMSIVLPGDLQADQPGDNPFFEVVSVTTTIGSCSGRIVCDYGRFPAGATGVITLELRARAPFSGKLTVRPDAGSTVEVPVGSVARVADLALATAAPTARLDAGGRFRATAVVANKGPHATTDTVVSVGLPRGITASVSVDGRRCSATPVRCTIPALAAGASATIAVSGTATLTRSAGIPMGVTTTAVDQVPANNVARIVLMPAPGRAAKP